MKKQKIIFPIIVILIFAVFIFVGVRGRSGDGQPQTGNITAPSWESPATPTQSPPVNISDVPQEAIKLEVSSRGIIPQSFEAEAKEEVLLSITSGDEWTHIFRFEDESLKNVSVGVGPEQVRMIKFYAPEAPGQYEFFCGVPGHKDRGEKGIMSVK